MAAVRSGAFLGQLGALFSSGAAGACTDAQLLARFRAGPGEAAESAFAALVERHGPMVWRVCRILLADAHEAEDAFQATFLVLARKAGSLREPDRLANWLYGVAHRVARKARSRGGRRRSRQAGEDEMAGLEFVGREQPLDLALIRREEAAIVHQELERLPEKHRTAIVLCGLEGLTIEEAARRIRCTPGAVRGRLAQARARLRARLARRGVAVPAAVVAAALSTRAASAAVPAALRDATTRAVAGAASTASVALAVAVSRSMLAARVAITGGLILGLGIAGIVAAPRAAQPPARSKAAPRQAPASVGPGAVDHRRLVEDLDWFLSAVDSARGKISLEDLPDRRGGQAIARTGARGGVGPTGLTMSGLVVAPDARITLDGRPAELKSLRPGMRAAVRLAADRFAAVEVRATSPQPAAFRYVVESVDAGAWTITVALEPKGLRLEKIRVADDAPIRLIRTQPVGDGPDLAIRTDAISLRDLRPGMFVSLTLDVTEGGGLVARSIQAGGTAAEEETHR
jgi:RNA polymerase sigma factor (sigma-70 family)